MTAHLLLVTLGPVQDFIAQARRTRDLWYGSHLLSELGRAAARALVDGGAQLIFPSLQANDAQLADCLAPLRADKTPPQNIANKLLAQVPDGCDPRELAQMTRKAVADYWRDKVAAPVKKNCARLLANDIDAVGPSRSTASSSSRQAGCPWASTHKRAVSWSRLSRVASCYATSTLGNRGVATCRNRA